MDNEILQIWKDIKKWLSSTYYIIGFIVALKWFSEAGIVETGMSAFEQFFVFIIMWAIWFPLWAVQWFI